MIVQCQLYYYNVKIIINVSNENNKITLKHTNMSPSVFYVHKFVQFGQKKSHNNSY